jgi:glycine/D-amino acid oxidase-like deaminating enzyme
MNEDFVRHPYWWDDTPPWSPPDAGLPASCDVAVVGGGIAGLSTALELARNGVSVTVLEADELGFNASCRNSGGVSIAIDATKAALWHKLDGNGKSPPPAEVIRAAADSLAHTEKFIADNSIDCEYGRNGRLSCAPTPAFYDVLARRVDRLNKLTDAGAYMVPRFLQHTEIGSEAFYGTMVVPYSGQLNPAKYHRGIAERCIGAGVAIHSGTQVRAIDRGGAGFRVRTSKGGFEAANVVTATNAHRQPVDKPLNRKLVPVASHIIVTEPLDDKVADSILPNKRSGADNRRVLAFFRRTPDGRRFLYGGRASPVELSEVKTARILYRNMVRQFPQLEGVRLGHAWGCRVAFSFDALPHMGVEDGIYYVMGCNGNGVAIMGYLGYHLARKILTGEKSACVFDQPNFPKPPLYSGRPWFLPVVAGAYRTLDTIDRLRN